MIMIKTTMIGPLVVVVVLFVVVVVVITFEVLIARELCVDGTLGTYSDH